MAEEDKLIIGMVVCMTLFFLAMVWVVYYPGKPKYVINYEQPATIEKLPYQLFDDPPIEKELGDWTLKYYEVPKGEIKLTEREELAESMTYLGCYTLTAYIATGSPCADGSYPQVGYTIACNDPSLWHQWIYIEGVGVRYVHDTGGMPTGTILDVFVGSYDEAMQFGVRSANVYLID